MKTWVGSMALGALLLQLPPLGNSQIKDFRYVRDVTPAAVGSSGPATACAVLDGALYAHTESLRDVRLFAANSLVPYALSSSGTTTEENESAQVLNLGTRAGHLVFDLRMPLRAYSAVSLDLRGADYLATARVTGLRSLGETPGTALGTFTLFNLTRQHLGSAQTLPLAESTFPFLHVDLALKGAEGAKAPPNVEVAGATVPPSREAQTLYTTVAQTTEITQRGRQSVAIISLPAHVPVERVRFVLDSADRTNFSRAVQLTATVHPDDAQRPQPKEQLTGGISRVRLSTEGKEIRQESLAVTATLGINAQAPASVEITIENGDDKPLALRAVLLEMRERKLCFDDSAHEPAPLLLAYGNKEVAAPEFDYARLFQPGQPARVALLGPERSNPAFVATADKQSFTERHPELLWVALLALVAVLGAVAFRSAKKM